MKDIIYWNAKVQEEIDNYPDAVRDRINFELIALQGDYPHSFDNFDFYEVLSDGDLLKELKMEYPPAQKKSMREAIGRYAMQLTIKSTDSYRMIYVAKFEEAIYVLHTFKKKTEGVARKDCKTAAGRYKQLEEYRKKNVE
ncbi:hypothetical protein C6H68_19540 [Photorhabdus luminescens]|nr:hypothetical protein C6H68_19540 [Photorhabdus luminescens]